MERFKLYQIKVKGLNYKFNYSQVIKIWIGPFYVGGDINGRMRGIWFEGLKIS